MLSYVERPAPPAISAHVECVWAVWEARASSESTPRTSERIVPDGRPEVIVHLADPFRRRSGARWLRQPRAFLAGTLTRPWTVRAGRRVLTIGLRLRPATAGLLGAPATPFRLVEIADRRVVFGNEAHDFPQRILYWLDDKGVLHVRIEGKLHGKPASDEWAWTKAR